MIKNIIFDFGGVILKHKATLTKDILSEMFPNSKTEIEALWNEYKVLLNTGKKSSREFIIEAKKRTSTDSSLHTLRQKWSNLYKREANDVDWELLDFIEKLKAKYKIYLFTDTIDVHDEYNKTRNIYERFHGVYKSFEEGVAKAAGKEAYLYLLDKIEANPEECIFIDDLEENIKIANEVDITGIIYKNLDQLKDELKLRGISLDLTLH